MAHRSEADIIANVHNAARFFTEHRQVAFIFCWVFLLGPVRLPEYAQAEGSQYSDPVAVASTQWPGATAQEVEQQVTRQVEQTMAQNAFVAAHAFGFWNPLHQLSGLSMVYVQMDDAVKDTKKNSAISTSN